MSNYVRAPLGTEPYYIAADRRVIALAKAIERYATLAERGKTKIMREWAKEIICQCDLIDNMQEENDE